jgi:hypothetical protein
VDLPVVLSSVSNFQLPYRSPDWECDSVLELSSYLGNREAFRQIVRSHRAVVHSYEPALAVPFFAVRIPHAVFTAVGNLDEGFGPGGGEDLDYCMRCHLAGFRVQFAMDSYLLHFQGKSTWRGPESVEQHRTREQAWRQVFRDKWGSRLFELVCLERSDGVPGDDVVRRQLARGDFRGVVEQLRGIEDWGNGTLLADLYYAACHTPSDINGHCPVLADLSRECRHVTELGTRTTTFGAQGESPGHRGLWPAVEEFLAQGTFWVRARHDHNNGLTVLERVP